MPLDKKIPITSKDLMICCKCFELMQGTSEGSLRILDSRERAFLLVHRGAEIIHFIRAAAVASEMDKTGTN